MKRTFAMILAVLAKPAVVYKKSPRGSLALKYLPGHNLDRYRRQAKKGVFSPCQ